MAIIEGALSGNLLEVDADKRATVNLPTAGSSAGFVAVLAEHDAGTITGTRDAKALDISEDYRLRTGIDTLMFNEWFSGSSLNTTLWTSVDNLSSASISGGFLTLNASGSQGATMQSRVQSYRTFPVYGTFGVYGEFLIQFPYAPVAENVCEWGFGNASGSSTPSDGAYFRLNATGEFRCVVNWNSTENQSDTLDFNSIIGTNTTVHCIVNITDDAAEFWVNDILVARIERPTAGAAMVTTGNMPILMRCYNVATASSAQQMKVSMVNVSMGDMSSGKPWPHILAGMGANSSQGQTGGILGSTAGITNSQTAVTTALMTNTTAALGTGLGGQFTTNMNTGFLSGSSAIDGIVCSYQVPAGTVVRPGKLLYILGVDIFCAVAGSVVATGSIVGGPILFAFSLAYGHTAVSLATAQSATTKAPIRVPLGFLSIPANAPSGTIATGTVSQDFQVPIVVNPGEFVAVAAKNLSLALTTAGTVTFHVRFGGYWE